MIRRPPRSTQSRSSAASDVYKRQLNASASTRATLGTGRITAVNALKPLAFLGRNHSVLNRRQWACFPVCAYAFHPSWLFWPNPADVFQKSSSFSAYQYSGPEQRTLSRLLNWPPNPKVQGQRQISFRHITVPVLSAQLCSQFSDSVVSSQTGTSELPRGPPT